MFLQIVDFDLRGCGPLLPPLAVPYLRTAKHGVWIDGVDADARLRAFKRQAAGKMNLGRLCGAIGSGVRGGGKTVLRGDEDNVAADILPPKQPESLARHQEISGRQ